MALTEKREAYCQKFVELGDMSEAYREAYPKSRKWKDRSVNVEASKLHKNTNVLLRVKELQDEAKKRSEVTVDKKKAWLVQVVEQSLRQVEVTDNEGTGIGEFKFDGGTVVRAINELNKMDGDHSAVKSELTGKNGKPIETKSNVLVFNPVGNK